MEIIEMRTGITSIFALAVALFFLHKYAANPLKTLLAKAAKNDPEAQYQMGQVYYKNEKEFDHFRQAFMWFETAANSGHVRAMIALADMLQVGEGCNKNLKRATNWYKTAADMGDATAKERLAQLNTK
jgi:TPR repeat protein